jgi:hypothetical protein
MTSVYIIISIIGFIAYRMLRFNNLNKRVKIISNEEIGSKDNFDGSFEINSSKLGYVKKGENIFSFFLIYKGLNFTGKYVSTLLLNNVDLQSMVLQYESTNELNEKYDVEFNYRTKIIPKKELNFYFNVNKN